MQIYSNDPTTPNHTSNHLLVEKVSISSQENDEVCITSTCPYRWLGDPLHKEITVRLDRIEMKQVSKVYQSMLKRDLEDIAMMINTKSSWRLVAGRIERFQRYWELSRTELDNLLLQLKSPLEEYKQAHQPAIQQSVIPFFLKEVKVGGI